MYIAVALIFDNETAQDMTIMLKCIFNITIFALTSTKPQALKLRSVFQMTALVDYY